MHRDNNRRQHALNAMANRYLAEKGLHLVPIDVEEPDEKPDQSSLSEGRGCNFLFWGFSRKERPGVSKET